MKRIAIWMLLTCAAQTGAQQYTFFQITETPFGFGFFEPSADAAGTRIAFSGAFDFTGGNPEQNFEIYLYDTDEDAITQLTDTPTGFGMFEPLITDDGSLIVFRAAFDFTGENPTNRFQLYEIDFETLDIRQLTFIDITAIFEADLSGGGRYLTYRTGADPVGMNPDNSFEVFRHDRVSGDIKQVTVTTGPANFTPTINRDGSRIAFRSAQSFDGLNPEGNFEIWRWSIDAGIQAVTSTPGGTNNEMPMIDGTGERVAFQSRFDFTGGNPGGSREIYVADIPSGAFQQATVAAPSLLHLEPVISDDGSLVVFDSMRDPLGTNPDNNREIFQFNVNTGTLTQITDTVGGASIPQLSDRAQTNYAAIAAHGCRFAIRNDRALEPGMPNSGNNLELFLASRDAAPGDADDDGDVDLDDVAAFFDCSVGPENDPNPTPPMSPTDCRCSFDADADGDVDFADFAAFQLFF